MKKVYSLALIGLGFCFGAVNTSSANASELIQSNSETIIAGSMSESSTKMTNYLLGTVAGKSGEIMSIRVEDGGSFQADGYILPGTKVLVGLDENGEYHLISSRRSEWMSVLQKDYNAERSEMLMGEMGTTTASMSRIGVTNNQPDTTVYDPAGDKTENSSYNRVTTGNNTTSTSSMPDRDVDRTEINTSSTQMNTTTTTTTTQINSESSMDMDDDDMDMDMDMEDQNQPVRGLW